MLLTESEAKNKRWCRHARQALLTTDDRTGEVRAVHPVAINRYPRSDAGCIGSLCMAWRWASRAIVLPGEEPKGYCGAEPQRPDGA